MEKGRDVSAVVPRLCRLHNTDVGSHLSAWPLLPSPGCSEGKRIGHGAVTSYPSSQWRDMQIVLPPSPPLLLPGRGCPCSCLVSGCLGPGYNENQGGSVAAAWGREIAQHSQCDNSPIRPFFRPRIRIGNDELLL